MFSKQLGDSLLDFSPLESSSTQFSANQEYHPFRIPANINMAVEHGQAQRIYKHASRNSLTRMCPCCGLPVKGESISLMANLSELYMLGSGYALYFKLIKYCIALLMLIFIFTGFFSTFTNVIAGNCSEVSQDSDLEYCITNSILKFSIANKRNNSFFLKLQMILTLVTIIILFGFFQFVHYQARKTIVKADNLTVTPSDYTVEVNGLSPSAKDKDIIDWIEGLGDENTKIHYEKINRAYNISKYIKLYHQKGLLMSQYKRENNPILKGYTMADIFEVDKAMKEFREKDLRFTGNVYISFETAQQADFLVKEFHKGLDMGWFKKLTQNLYKSTKHFYGKKVNIRRAPEPTDIIWENHGYDPIRNLKRRITSELGAAALVGAGFICIVMISWGQYDIVRNVGNDSELVPVLSIVVSLFVISINYLLAVATRILSKREKQTTFTAYFTNIARRLCVSMFINTALTTLLAKIAAFFSFGEKANSDIFNFYRRGGLLEDMFFVFLSNALSMPLYTLFHPRYLYKIYQQRKAIHSGPNCPLTQQKAHELFEGPELDFPFKHAFLSKTVLVSAFFAPAIPLALVVSIVGLILCYWTDKYVLLRRCSLPASLDHALSNHILKTLEWTPFMLCAGSLVFIITLQDFSGSLVYSDIPNWLIFTPLALSILYVFIPTKRLNEFFFPIPHRAIEDQTYEDARVSFATDYDIENPVTCREGLNDFLQFLKSREKHLVTAMNGSVKKGAFKTLKDSHLKNLVTCKSHSESLEVKKENDLAFLDEYAAQIPRTFARQRSGKENGVELGKILEVSEENQLEESLSHVNFLFISQS